MKILMDSDNVGRDMWEKRKSFSYLFLRVMSSDKPHQSEKGLLPLIIVNDRISTSITQMYLPLHWDLRKDKNMY